MGTKKKAVDPTQRLIRIAQSFLKSARAVNSKRGAAYATMVLLSQMNPGELGAFAQNLIHWRNAVRKRDNGKPVKVRFNGAGLVPIDANPFEQVAYGLAQCIEQGQGSHYVRELNNRLRLETKWDDTHKGARDEEFNAKVIRLWNVGWTDEQLADLLDASKGSIEQIRRRERKRIQSKLN